MPDDAADIQKSKSVMRWDAKKKKYLPVMVSADGRVLKSQRRNESGVKVKGEAEKSNLYKKWATATKRRIQKVGEMEEGVVPLGRLEDQSKNRALEFADGDTEGRVVEPEA